MRNRFAPSALLATALALMTMAATADDLKGLYAGIGIGSTSVDDNFSGLDDSDTSFKIFAGYSFNKFLALELSYLDGGTVKDAQSFSIPGTPLNFSSNREVDNRIINLSVVGNLPLTESLSLFGKLGYANIDTETSSLAFLNGSGSPSVDDNNRQDLSYGAGASYSFGKSFQLRAEYEGFNVSRGELSAISLSGILRF